MKEIVRATLGLFAALLLCALTVSAQTTQTGAIVGRATDSTGAVIPGVEVTITSPQMIGGAKTEVTDEQGVYRFELLPAGVYKVTFALPGFKTLNYTEVNVQPNITMTQNGAMEVSASAEEVTVTSQAPAIDLQAATLGVNWSQKMIDDLPWSRSLVAISAMIPNALATSYDVGNSSFGTSSTITAQNGGFTNSSGSSANMVSMDGLMWCQTYEDYGTYEEMNVSTNAKGAEQLNAGITLNLVVKSGSNTFHGNLSAAYQNGSMQSNNVTPNLIAEGYSAGSTKYTHFTDYYGDIGGPILKDRFWFYGAYRTGYQGEFIPGFVTAVGGTPQVFYTSLRSPTAKLTYQITPKQKFEVYLALPDKEQPYRNASALEPQTGDYHELAYYGQGPVFTWTDIINSRTTATLKFARGGLWQSYAAQPMPAGYGPTLGLTAGGSQPIPVVPFYGMDPTMSHIQMLNNVGVAVTDLTTGAVDGAYSSIYERQIRWQWNADVSHVQNIFGKANEIKVGYMGWWDIGAHNINYGVPYQQTYRYQSVASDPQCPNSSICSFDFLHPNSVQLTNLPDITATGGKYDGSYINDKITLSRKLTLNVGVRWDHTSTFLPAQGNSGSGPYATPLLIPYSTSVTNPANYGGLGIGGDVAQFPVYNLVTPRVSLAYDLFGNGRLALKGSYGRYSTISSSPGAQIGPVAGTSISPIATQTCTFNNWNGVIPYVPQFGAQAYLGSPTNQNLASSCAPAATINGVPVGAGVHEFDPSLKATFLSEWTAGAELGLSKDYSLRFNTSRKFGVGGDNPVNVLLPYSSYTNQTCAVDALTGIQNVCYFTVPSTNPNRLLTDVRYTSYNLSAHEGESTYTSYDITFNKQYAHGWSFLTGTSFYLVHPGTPIPLTPNQAYTLSQNDLPYWIPSFKMNGTYELPAIPLFVGHKSFPGLLWSSTFTSQKGAWYGRSAQVKDALGTTDNVLMQGHFGRLNTLTDWDQRITKRFKIKDRDTIELKWDLYNTLNGSAIQSYKGTASASSFSGTGGQTLVSFISSAATPTPKPSTILAGRIYEWSASFKF